MANPGAALGQAVGKLIELQIASAVSEVALPRGYSVLPRKLKNGQNNEYQIDCVVSDSQGNPVIIIDPKYIRYKKHNRDKGSWLCTAHYSLRKTFPSIRKSITVLSGNWSVTSVALIRSFGIEVHQIPFQRLVNELGTRSIPFDWDEKDAATPSIAWDLFQRLPNTEKEAIISTVVAPVLPSVVQSVVTTLEADMNAIQRRVSSIEVLLKTTQDEYLLYLYPSVSHAIQGMLRFLTDRQDIPDIQELLH